MFSFKVLSWAALAAVVLFLVLIALQMLELNYYGTNPTVW